MMVIEQQHLWMLLVLPREFNALPVIIFAGYDETATEANIPSLIFGVAARGEACK